MIPTKTEGNISIAVEAGIISSTVTILLNLDLCLSFCMDRYTEPIFLRIQF